MPIGRLIGFLTALLLAAAGLGQPVLADVVAPADHCCSFAASGAGDDLVDLYRAPQPGQATGPLDPADFPGRFANGYPDGRSYWTLNRELADEYATAYGTDVISVSIPRGDYDAMLDVLKHAPGAGEFPYPGPGGHVEVAIPRWMVPWLNNFGPG